MHLQPWLLGVGALWLGMPGILAAGEGHRLVVLDMLTSQRGEESQLLTVDVESGNVLAKIDVGPEPEIGISPRGDTVAALTYNTVGGHAQPNARLQVFRSADLT